MNPLEPTPLHCRPEAFDALAQELDALDTTRGLLRCALAVSMHQLPSVDMANVEAQIDALAGSISDRVSTAQPRALLAHAHAVLFDEARFSGNTDNYYHPNNSYVSKILETGEGLPITLVLLYKCVLETLGLRVLGINAPGHFLAGIVEPAELPDNDADQPTPKAGAAPPSVSMLIDPFYGGKMLTREEAFARIEEVAGGSVMRDDSLLRPATHAEWLTRIIQNLVTAFDKLGRGDDMSAMLEMRALVESVT